MADAKSFIITSGLVTAAPTYIGATRIGGSVPFGLVGKPLAAIMPGLPLAVLGLPGGILAAPPGVTTGELVKPAVIDDMMLWLSEFLSKLSSAYSSLPPQERGDIIHTKLADPKFACFNIVKEAGDEFGYYAIHEAEVAPNGSFTGDWNVPKKARFGKTGYAYADVAFIPKSELEGLRPDQIRKYLKGRNVSASLLEVNASKRVLMYDWKTGEKMALEQLGKILTPEAEKQVGRVGKLDPVKRKEAFERWRSHPEVQNSEIGKRWKSFKTVARIFHWFSFLLCAGAAYGCLSKAKEAQKNGDNLTAAQECLRAADCFLGIEPAAQWGWDGGTAFRALKVREGFEMLGLMEEAKAFDVNLTFGDAIDGVVKELWDSWSSYLEKLAGVIPKEGIDTMKDLAAKAKKDKLDPIPEYFERP